MVKRVCLTCLSAQMDVLSDGQTGQLIWSQVRTCSFVSVEENRPITRHLMLLLCSVVCVPVR